MNGMHMSQENPTRLERKLSKELEKEAHREQKALHHHLKNLEKAERHRREAEHLRQQLAKLQIKEIRIQERIQEHEIKARELEAIPSDLRGHR
ncbi:MAG: hypothetical protein JSW25_08465 [Thermoplasmata archaeon]|nr:MAG: hypothetical protein JSW25_08465 [Thermoplasmata archaeon]